LVGDVGLHHQHLASETLCHRIHRCYVDVDEHDRGALGRKPFGRRATEAAACAGDDRHLAVEPPAHDAAPNRPMMAALPGRGSPSGSKRSSVDGSCPETTATAEPSATMPFSRSKPSYMATRSATDMNGMPR